MRRTFLTILLLLLPLSFCQAQAPPVLPPVEIHLSPKGGCTEAVVKEIDAAKTDILAQAYSFTSVPIAKALVDTHKRGVKFQVILDKSQKTEKYSSADFVRNAGIPTLIDARHAIAHNKVMVIDGGVVITGSFNFTKAAETNNAENMLVIRDKGITTIITKEQKMQAQIELPKAFSVSNDHEFFSFQHLMARLNPKLMVEQVATGKHVNGGCTVFWGIVYLDGQQPSKVEVESALKEAGFDFDHNVLTQAAYVWNAQATDKV